MCYPTSSFPGAETRGGSFLALAYGAVRPFKLPRVVPHAPGLVCQGYPAVRVRPAGGQSTLEGVCGVVFSEISNS